MSTGEFDVNSWDSWFFGSLSLDESTRLLQHQDIGVFLVRESTRTPGGYVVCINFGALSFSVNKIIGVHPMDLTSFSELSQQKYLTILDFCNHTPPHIAITYNILRQFTGKSTESKLKSIGCTHDWGIIREKDGVAQYVINWKLVDDVKQYYIREESNFPDVPALLSFYKRNLFKTTPLIRPFSKNNDPSIVTRTRENGTVNSQIREQVKSEVTGVGSNANNPNLDRISAPAGYGNHAKLLDPDEVDDGPPCFARVTKMITPSPYNHRALKLSVGDIVQVLKRCQSGQWEGKINGKRGMFPATHVDMLPENENNTLSSGSFEAAV